MSEPVSTTDDQLLTDDQLQSYREDGYLLLPNYFSETEVEAMLEEYDRLKDVDSPGRVMEEDGELIRALHGCHRTSDLFGDVVRLSRLVAPTRQILGGDVYVYQFKINSKEAMGGEAWQWHQDFIFWKNEDGMPEPLAVNVAVFLDEVTEFNGPLIVVPGSHEEGVLPPAGADRDGDDWEDNVSADLSYTIGGDTLKDVVDEREMVAPKGGPGSVLFFHPNVVHGSVGNLSPQDRKLLIVTYNRSDNAPDPDGIHRPEFLVSRDSEPIEALDQGWLDGKAEA
jgi:ectoine hydroxylase